MDASLADIEFVDVMPERAKFLVCSLKFIGCPKSYRIGELF